MKRTAMGSAVAMIGAGLLALGAVPALGTDDFCEMGGTLIKTEIVKDKALDWAQDRREAQLKDEDSDAWSVLTLSRTDDGIAVLVTPGSIFFGVAGKGGREVDTRVAEKAFGNDLRKLREAVKREMLDFWKAGVIKIQGGEIQALSEAAGLGALEKGSVWELKTRNCKGVDLDTSGLQ